MRPPSAVSICAVIQPDAGAARKTTALAMSSGFSDAPHHGAGSKIFLGPRPVRSAAAALGHVGAHETRRHRIHGYPVRPQLQGKAPRQDCDLGFCRGVEGIAGKRGADRRNRAQIDNTPITPRPHVADHRLRRMDQTLHVDATHVRNPFLVVAIQCTLPRNAGIVDEDGHRSKLAFSARDHGFDRGSIGDVCRDGNSASSCCLELGDEVPRRLRMPGVVDAYRGAALGEEPRCRSA